MDIDISSVCEGWRGYNYTQDFLRRRFSFFSSTNPSRIFTRSSSSTVGNPEASTAAVETPNITRVAFGRGERNPKFGMLYFGIVSGWLAGLSLFQAFK